MSDEEARRRLSVAQERRREQFRRSTLLPALRPRPEFARQTRINWSALIEARREAQRDAGS